ncbi:16S rRNA (guanine(966)-N(2))-methyltransferase RsmD [Rosettibacter firmus]|uniref:16S rRNA (guanine(966)-N(2))-methyltransferase RsmD n=1 Tax=Rosettibacter firmus TaxID=3111522 RepID=UPI00336BEA24
MRIIAGKYKGRIIKFPNSKLVRPTTDKVKESLFNYLSNQIDFEGIKVCDIYAGSGSLGLEALSRGAAEVHFVEKDFFVVKVLKENILSLDAEENCKIYKTEAIKFTRMKNHDKYDLILADPPFFKNDIHMVVRNIIERNYLIENGIMIVERSVQTKSEDTENFKCEPFKKIGDSLIYLFENN